MLLTIKIKVVLSDRDKVSVAVIMRILQVVQFFSPNHGGSAMVPYELSKHLRDAGHDVTVITTDFQMNNDFISSLDGVEVIPFHCQLDIGGVLVSSSIDKYLRLNANEFDVIHMHNFRTYQNIIVHKFAKKHKIPYVLQAHGSVPRIIEKKGLKYLFDLFFGYKILRDSSKVIAVSNVEIDQYLQMNLPIEKVVVIPNGIETNSFINLPEKGTFKKQYDIFEKHIVLFLGRLHEIKGIDFLIKSYAELKKELDDIVLVLAGPNHGYKATAEMLINTLNLKKEVKFIDYIDGVDKLAAYVDADVLVYPSKYEIFGLVPFEALMCDTPVIVTENCGCSDILQDLNCVHFVKYDDIDGLSQKIREIIGKNRPMDRLMCDDKNYIKNNLSWDKVIDKYIEIYFQILDDQIGEKVCF